MPNGLSLTSHGPLQTAASLDAVFYPHLHFSNRRWLRTAALYFDSVSRIVPAGLDPELLDTDEQKGSYAAAIDDDVRQLKSCGFARDEVPDIANLTAVANDFFDFAVKQLADPSRRAQLLPSLNVNNPYIIHRQKLDPVLLDVLAELKLVHREAGDDYSDIAIEPVTGGLYVLFLASRIADTRPLVSDDPTFQSLLYTKLEDTQKPRSSDGGFRLATAVLEAVVPGDIEKVALDRILRLREDFAEGRRKFQDKIQSFARTLEESSTEDELQETVDRTARTLKEEQNEFAQTLWTSKLDFVKQFLSVSVPSHITAQWGLGISSPYLLAGIGAIAVSPVVVKHIMERRSALKSPYRYVMAVDRLAKAAQIAEDIVTLELGGSQTQNEHRHGRRRGRRLKRGKR